MLSLQAPLLGALLLVGQASSSPASVQADVLRLVRAAEQQTDVWRSQAPPPVREVALVARHGRAAAPLLLELLSDDPDVERDRKRWSVQQQATLALARIYDDSQHCGRIYCDGDPPERIRGVMGGWLKKMAWDAELRALSPAQLVQRFLDETATWRQFEIGRVLAEGGDRGIGSRLAPLLGHDSRRIRGNAAFVLARLGDPRGLQTIEQILADRSSRPPADPGMPKWTLEAQIQSDRYYATVLLGRLKDRRAVPLLLPLMRDGEIETGVVPALGAIGDPRAIPALVRLLDEDDPSVRVTAIGALELLRAKEALPRFRELLVDRRPSNFGDQVPVSEAARRAIAVIGLP